MSAPARSNEDAASDIFRAHGGRTGTWPTIAYEAVCVCGRRDDCSHLDGEYATGQVVKRLGKDVASSEDRRLLPAWETLVPVSAHADQSLLEGDCGRNGTDCDARGSRV